ncbi:MerR family transcriptional regulator [Micromonospora rosaria]|uniref:MerR family transcriptional regulator n=1 Tax=Micromonospora rosaria TaxID=47874 RepID=A0A136PIQ9_9ACTN|nr:MerR family transcriptional regulator [Micromonospora rosaria]KXK58296.1 MerR family transcriptional regulator [Micromonospora rosaria]
MDTLYSIGDVARRTGLSVSAIRFYSDTGIITPTGHTDAGHRRYDIRAVARLELVGTLRDLGASLDDIRQLLADQITLRDLATAHLVLVERHLSRFRARRAVLRTIVRLDSATEQVGLMQKLVSLSDDERDQLVEDFWAQVTEGLDLHDLVDYLRPWRPRLPEEPTCEQLEAWIELADMVRDDAFRQEVRHLFHETFAPAAARERDSPPTDAEVEHQVAILAEARAAAEAGLPVDSPQARELAGRYVTSVAALVGDQDIAEVRRQIAAADPGPHVARHVDLLGRYHALTATINGTPRPEQGPDATTSAPASTWLHAAVTALS